MATLPTNLKDDILDASVNQRRRYNMITNPDGTVEFEDVTAYSQVGSEYGAGLINETNKQINGKVDDSKIVRDLKTIGAMTQEGFIPDALALKEVNESLGGLQFGYDETTQKYGYYKKEADTDVFVPFSGIDENNIKTGSFTASTSAVHVENLGFKPSLVIFICYYEGQRIVTHIMTENTLYENNNDGDMLNIDGDGWNPKFMSITENGFNYKAPAVGYARKTVWYAI